MVGNTPNFTKMDVLRCFLRFSRKIGRQEIAKELELGEGTVRTILETLKAENLLDSTKKGHFLSKKGTEILNRIYDTLSMPRNVALHDIYPNLKKIGVVVRNASNIRETYKLRDIAVKNGADGALILKFENKLYAPESGYEQDYRELEKSFDFRNGDIFILAFSSERKYAENGSLAIAVELDSYLKKFISGLSKEVAC